MSQICVITNVDSFYGYVIAHRFLQGLQEERGRGMQEHRVRLLCRDTQGLEKLKELGGEICQVDYRDIESLRKPLQNVKVLMLFPEHSPDMRQEGEMVIRCARECNAEYLAMFSILGADCAKSQERVLQNYRHLEQQVQQQFRENHCVVRSAMFNQMFYYLAPMVEDRNQLCLPVNKDRRWGSVNIRDVADAVWRLSRQKESSRIGPFGKKRLYEFTPQRNRNGPEIAQSMSEGLGMERKVEYRQIPKEEIMKYLEGIREDERFRRRPESSNRDNQDSSHHDRPHNFPLGRFLNEHMIYLMCEYWLLADRGEMDKVSRDMQEALGREPQDLRQYFESNRDQFRRLR